MSYNAFLHAFPAYGSMVPLIERDIVKTRSWESGDYICRMGDEIDELVFLISGKGRVSRQLSNGREVLFKLYGAGDIVGDVEYVTGRQATSSVRATTEISGYALPFDAIADDVSESLFRLLSQGIAVKLIGCSRQQSLRQGYSLRERLAFYLAYGDTAHIGSMEELAAVLGATYRHLSRTFGELTADGLIRMDKKSIEILDRDGLLSLCSDLEDEP